MVRIFISGIILLCVLIRQNFCDFVNVLKNSLKYDQIKINNFS